MCALIRLAIILEHYWGPIKEENMIKTHISWTWVAFNLARKLDWKSKIAVGCGNYYNKCLQKALWQDFITLQ